MVVRKKSKSEKLLTEVELQIMNIIWDLGDCNVKDVQNALPADRDLAYTSVATFMKILEEKGALKSTKDDRAHSYHALLTRADYEAISLRHLQANVFRGNPSSLVMRLLDDAELSKEEVSEIRAALAKRLKT